MRVDEILAARARVTDYLIDHGFAPCVVPNWVSSPHAVAFSGRLGARSPGEPVKVVISDWDFLSPPSIVLSETSRLRVGIHPHVGKDGALCYRTEEAGVLNAFAPENAIAACLAQAQRVIDQILAGGKWSDAEFQREFEAYWDGDAILSCDLHGTKDEGHVLFSEDVSRLHGWLYLDEAKARAVITAMGMKAAAAAPAVIIHTRHSLSIGIEGAPTHLKALLAWVRRHDSSAETHIRAVLERKDYFTGPPTFIFLAGNNATVGFTVTLTGVARRDFARRPREFPHRVRSPNMPPLPIQRWTVSDASPEMIYSRNGQESLAGKRITLVGAGAIGGYLADALVRLGAGHAGGRLTIVDPDILLPENIARHRLGMDNVFKSKAQALAYRLRSEFPWLTIEAVCADARRQTKLFAADLVIDATGEEALGRAINRLHQAGGRSRDLPPILYCWIAGEGEGVQSLWVETHGDHACWECLFVHGKHGEHKLRFPFAVHDAELRLVGCHAVTPYAVSAAMSAAALAAEAVGDWLTGTVHPRFRSRARSHAEVSRIKDHSPDRLQRCPACSRS